MVDFSNVVSQQVSSQNTTDYELFDIDMPGATLVVAPATRSNKPYNNAQMKLMIPQQRRVASGKVSPEFIEKYRDDMKPIYANHVVVNWRNIVDSSGADVPFSKEVCLEFLKALPAQVWDNLSEFCENESNFRESSVEDLAKN